MEKEYNNLGTAADYLAWMENAKAKMQRAEEELKKCIRGARTQGASWEAIGKTLGLSKQTAFNRYKAEERPQNEVQEHHAEAVKFLDGQEPAKPETPAKPAKKPSKKLDDKAPADPRPSFTLHSAGMIDGVAQPGTGKGPHACPRCGSTNHKSGKQHTINAYPGECKPTKYDPQDIADVLTNYLKASN